MSSHNTAHGHRFFGSVDTFVYADDRLRPTWEPPQDYRFTAEHRHQLCVHLAAHAAISSLGGMGVFMLAVASGGVRSWAINERKNDALDKKFGQCSTSDFYCKHIEWDEARQIYVADRAGWEEDLEQAYEDLWIRCSGTNAADMSPDGPPTLDEVIAERRREVRAYVCAYLAGPIADGITAGLSANEAIQLYDRRDTQKVGKSDIAVARGLADLLSPDEYENAVRLTEEALHRPDVWGPVIDVAGQLEKLGLIENDECEIELDDWLPDPEEDWPPAPGLAN
jgi:hypothetical protein